MLLASTFADALFRADFVTALACPLGAAALLTLFLGVIGLIFFARESTKAKFVVFFTLALGVTLLVAEISKPTPSGLTAPTNPGYNLKPPPPPATN